MNAHTVTLNFIGKSFVSKITASAGERFGLTRTIHIDSESDIHVLPTNDLRQHIEVRDCWCDPQIQDENGEPQWCGEPIALIVIHNALDGRQ